MTDANRTITMYLSGSDASHAPRTQPIRELSDRYEDMGLIARGGMGEVRRVRDRNLDRVLAMKVVHAAALEEPMLRERFLLEARTTARLQHPNIVAIHDQGELDDGRLWFTMREVRGQTLHEVIQSLHSARRGNTWQQNASGWTLRRVASAFEQVCQAVAYAHDQDVVHRDIKPDNIMVGAFGEVQVMDWGLAKPLDSALTLDADGHQGPGPVMGTPLFMAPEQARGDIAAIGPWSDVWSLGVTMFEILAGVRPYEGSARQVLAKVRDGHVPALQDRIGANHPPLPGPLVELVHRAMRVDPGRRPEHAGVLAELVRHWLDGEANRRRALGAVTRADALLPRVRAMRQEADKLDAQAAERLANTASWATIEDKVPAWQQEDRAKDARVAADRLEVTFEGHLRTALEIHEGLPEAIERLGDLFRRQVEDAERRGDRRAARRSEQRLRAIGRHTSWLDGYGALTLLTDRPARVTLSTFTPHRRRLVHGPARDLGLTPLHAVQIPRGSHTATLHAEGCDPVTVPIVVGRGEHWDSTPPGGHTPHVHRLPRVGELGPDDILVPAGWTRIGGDADAIDALSGRRVWVDAFVIRRTPVRVRDYIQFLEALVCRGDKDLAERYQPMDTASSGGRKHAVPMLHFDGTHYVVPERQARQWHLDWPITHIDWHGAMAYARWLGANWRLPADLEWEKAARGVDGRRLPWGSHHDATWTNCIGSTEGVPLLVPVQQTAQDRSPYGALGMAGNARDWCIDAYSRLGQTTDGARLTVVPAADDDPTTRACRGGAFAGTANQCLSASRFGAPSTGRFFTVSLRLARSYR